MSKTLNKCIVKGLKLEHLQVDTILFVDRDICRKFQLRYLFTGDMNDSTW